MLDFIRQRAQGWVMRVLLILTSVPFVLFGVNSYMNRGGSEPAVATVGNSAITVTEFNQALSARRDQLRQMLGANADPALLDAPKLRQQVLDDLIDQRLLLLDAQRHHLAPTDAQTRQLMTMIPAFQDNGKFSPARLQEYLNEQHETPQQFLQQLREDVVADNAHAEIAQGAFVPASLTSAVSAMLEQQRDVSVAALPLAPFLAQTQVSDAAVSAWYRAHQQQFAVPEQVRVQYAVLSLDTLKQQEPVSDQEAQAWYDGNKARFTTQEQRRASHILIPLSASATPAEQQAARKLADSVYQQAVAHPNDFAALARKYSKDPGSAANGGDLGFFDRTSMVKPFADAVFAMKVGEISKPVQSQYGLHIIRLTAIKPAAVQPFAAVRAQAEDAVRTEKAQQQFNHLADTFNNVSYDQAGAIKPAADAVKVPVQTSGWISHSGSSDPLLGNPKLLAAIFSDDAIRDHHNTAPVEVQPNVLVVAHVIDHQAASVKPLAVVRADIQHLLAQQQAQKLAQAAADADVKALAAGHPVTTLSFGPDKTVTRQQPAGLTGPLLEAAFRANSHVLPAYVDAVDPQGGMAIVRVSHVAAGAAVAAHTKAIATQLESLAAEQQYRAWLAALRAATPVKIDNKVLAGAGKSDSQ